MDSRDRLRSLQRAMKARGLPALLVTCLPDVRYLTGFTGSNAALAVIASPVLRARLFTDGRYTAQAREEVSGATVRIAPLSALKEACGYLAAYAPACGFDSAHTSVAALAVIKSAAREGGAKGRFFQAADGLVSRLRTVKDAAELERMRRAASTTSVLYEGLLSWVEPGMRERDVAAELEHRARLAGAEAMSFETIVAAGERSSHPHARATGAHLRPGDLVTLDFGIVLDGYCSDMTRTFALRPGRMSPEKRRQWVEQRTVFDAVLAAQENAVAAVRDGVSCGDVDLAARSVLEHAGLARWFTHSTGHGVGLEIHEAPRVAKGQTEPLCTGTVITIEPGVYLPGRFGVRIEDTVVVTDRGAEVLTPAHKGWTEL